MFTNIPITKPASRAGSSSNKSQAPSNEIITWRFLDYREAQEFCWNNTAVYPEYSFTPFQRENHIEVVRKVRPEEEIDNSYWTRFRGVYHISSKLGRKLVKKS
jgi:hypothetical protein